MILSRSRQVVERRQGGGLIKSRVDYTPTRQTERLEVHTPGQVVVGTAMMEEGHLSTSKQIITPWRVVTIIHTEEDHGEDGKRVTDEHLVESTPLADLGRAPRTPRTPGNSRFQVYPPAPEEDEDFYGLYDDGDHGEPDCDCGGCHYDLN